MTMRMLIRHHSEYLYDSPVQLSYNEARITPLTTPQQLVLESTVEILPHVRPFRYWDYWGTVVHSFELHVPHRELLVTAQSTVETQPAADPVNTTWAALQDPAVADRFCELLAPTPYVPHDDERFAEIAAAVRAHPTPADAVDAAVLFVRSELVYESGVTAVHTSALDAWEVGRGVCQDYAHVLLAVLRRAGIPARYASGYLHPSASPPVGQAVAGESHAWVEVWTGGWWGIDPTNLVHAGTRHVLVGRGRDYADVTPFKGIYHGGAAAGLTVEVELTRVA